MELDLRKLNHFVVLAEELNFTRAAERLGVSQQALSASIRRLEVELDAPLFVRSTRQVALTEAGATLLDESRALLAASRATLTRVAERRTDPRYVRAGVGGVPRSFRRFLPPHWLRAEVC